MSRKKINTSFFSYVFTKLLTVLRVVAVFFHADIFAASKKDNKKYNSSLRAEDEIDSQLSEYRSCSQFIGAPAHWLALLKKNKLTTLSFSKVSWRNRLQVNTPRKDRVITAEKSPVRNKPKKSDRQSYRLKMVASKNDRINTVAATGSHSNTEHAAAGSYSNTDHIDIQKVIWLPSKFFQHGVAGINSDENDPTVFISVKKNYYNNPGPILSQSAANKSADKLTQGMQKKQGIKTLKPMNRIEKNSAYFDRPDEQGTKKTPNANQVDDIVASKKTDDDKNSHIFRQTGNPIDNANEEVIRIKNFHRMHNNNSVSMNRIAVTQPALEKQVRSLDTIAPVVSDTEAITTHTSQLVAKSNTVFSSYNSPEQTPDVFWQELPDDVWCELGRENEFTLPQVTKTADIRKILWNG